jgi:hypothetical protein
MGGQGSQQMQFQLNLIKDKIIVQSMNGLSEWQHFNALSMNNRVLKDVYYDKWTSQHSSKAKSASFKNKRDQAESSFQMVGNRNPAPASQEQQYDILLEQQLFKDTQTVSHSDAILDMAVIQMDKNRGYANSGFSSSLNISA